MSSRTWPLCHIRRCWPSSRKALSDFSTRRSCCGNTICAEIDRSSSDLPIWFSYINWQWHQDGTSEHKWAQILDELYIWAATLGWAASTDIIFFWSCCCSFELNKKDSFVSWLWQMSGSHQAVIKQSSGSKQTVLRQSSGSPQAVLRQSPLLFWQHNMFKNWPIIQWFTNLNWNWTWHK